MISIKYGIQFFHKYQRLVFLINKIINPSITINDDLKLTSLHLSELDRMGVGTINDDVDKLMSAHALIIRNLMLNVDSALLLLDETILFFDMTLDSADFVNQLKGTKYA